MKSWQALHNKVLNLTSTAALFLRFNATLPQNKRLRYGKLARRYNVSARWFNESVARFNLYGILEESGIKLFANFRFTIFVPGATMNYTIIGGLVTFAVVGSKHKAE